MTTKTYKSAILNAKILANDHLESKDNLTEIRDVFKGCGVEFPKGNLSEVEAILSTNDFMSWETNSKTDIQTLANNGIPSIAIFNDKIMIIEPESIECDSEYSINTIAATVNSIEDETARFYSYSRSSSVISTLDKLKGQFPPGKYWNHVGMSTNNADSFTYRPCPSHNTTSKCNDYNGSTQCIGFAYKCASVANNGANSFSFTADTNESAIDKVKPGDIIVYYTSGTNVHAVYVTKVLENGFVFGDCNGETETPAGYCRIRWEVYKEKSFFKSKLKLVRISPTTLSNF